MSAAEDTRAAPFVPELTRDEAAASERCPICSWPLVASIEEGCVPGNCSMRSNGDPHVEKRLRELREKAEAELRHATAVCRAHGRDVVDAGLVQRQDEEIARLRAELDDLRGGLNPAHGETLRQAVDRQITSRCEAFRDRREALVEIKRLRVELLGAREELAEGNAAATKHLDRLRELAWDLAPEGLKSSPGWSSGEECLDALVALLARLRTDLRVERDEHAADRVAWATEEARINDARAELVRANKHQLGEIDHLRAQIAFMRRDTARLLDVTRAAQRLRRVLAKEPRDPAAFALAAAELGRAVDAYEADPGGYDR